MSDNNSSSQLSLGRALYGVYWLANLIYTCMYWGGWADLWNFFLPYAMVFDFVKHMGRIH